MPTAIYLGNDRLQILSGKVSHGSLKIKYAYNEPIAEGVIINGIITNEVLLTEQINELKEKRKIPMGRIDVVVDSGDILTKTATVPIVNESKLKRLVAGEFAEAVADDKNRLYDYSVLLPKNPDGEGATVLCTAVDRGFVESYIDLFTKSNKNIRSLRLGLDCIIKLCTKLPELSDHTYVILLPDGNTLLAVLFVNGSYFFSQRTRLLEERGTPQSALEFNRRINFITQFNKSQNSGGEISTVYLCGLAPVEGGLVHELGGLCGLAVQLLPVSGILHKSSIDDFHPSDYCYTAGCLL